MFSYCFNQPDLNKTIKQAKYVFFDRRSYLLYMAPVLLHVTSTPNFSIISTATATLGPFLESLGHLYSESTLKFDFWILEGVQKMISKKHFWTP